MVLLVPQSSQKIQETVARVLALLAQSVDEGAVELGEEVAWCADDLLCAVFEEAYVRRC
jgi:hypothetical protein